MAANSIVRIEALGRDNYDTWKLQMRSLLIKNDAWGYVSGEITKPEPTATNAADTRDWRTKDEKAKSDLILSIGASQLKLVKNCETSRELWIKLENTFQSKGPARKATLLKTLILKKMCEGGDVREHLHDFFDAVDKLSEMDVIINPDQLAIMMLYSLPSSFENFRVAIESRDELPTPENLRTKIVEEFDARKSTATSSQDALLINKKKRNYSKHNSTNKEEQKKDKCFKFKCYKCHEKGHKASECPSQKTDDKGKVSLLLTEDRSDICQFADCTSKNRWCIDSGCTSHMCKDISLFTEINESKSGVLKLASDSSAKIQARGVAAIVTTANGKKSEVTLNETLHVPELRMNLLSVSKMTDRGYRVSFEKQRATITDQKGRTRLIAKRIGDLYYIDGESPDHCQEASTLSEESCHSVISMNTGEFWHRRMGHLNYRDLIQASKDGAIRGIDLRHVPEDLNCEICIQGKMTRPSFPKKSTRETDKLELIHTDICGPMRVTSNGGSRYFITFTDDRTRWTEIRFIKSKDQALEEFKAYQIFVEKQHGKKIKAIQSDNGREYVNKEFDEYLKTQGIQRRLTTAYSPEQNGVAERKNRTLVDSTRCLLLQSGLPPSFWAEAVSTANYIRNRCPTSKLNGRTPHEGWKGKTPTVNYFKSFGCKVFCINKVPTRGKLDPRSREGIFVGYSEESKGFRIWLPESKKIEITRDVKFLENSLGRAKTPFEDFYSQSTEMTPIDGVDVKLSSGYDNMERRNIEEIVVEPGEAEPGEAEPGEAEIEEPEGEYERLGQARRRGRPRLIRTGRPGRPRKEYSQKTLEQAEMACVAEIPITQAMSDVNSSEWMDAMKAEVISLIKNNAWKITACPKDQRVVGSRFVLRNKYNSDGSIEKRKARVVARGFSQRPGIDYHETFAPVARMSSIRAVLAIAAQRDMKIEQLDVATAYLNGEIEETIYMEAPEYLEDTLEHIIRSRRVDNSIRDTAKKMLEDIQKPNAVCLLIKALYGLRQSGRTWHSTLKEALEQLGAVQSNADPCVFLIGPIEDRTFIIVYVDDILIASRDTARIAKIKNHLSANFEIKDLGGVKYCLGLEFSREKNEIAIKQKGYINDILARFGMLDCKPVSTPLDPDAKLIKEEVDTDYLQPGVPYQELIGALMYLATSTRPDIAHTVSRLSQFNSCHTETHWRAAKRVLRYLKGTDNVGLVYSVYSDPPEMFADADWGNCNMDRKSYTGYTFLLSGGAISWESKKQHTVALSTTEAEYMALSEATKEALYIGGLLGELGITLGGITIKNDNNGALKLAMNPVFHARSKHIDIRHHFVRDAVSRGLVKIQHVSTDEMTADILTKGLPRGKHEVCMRSIGLKTIK